MDIQNEIIHEIWDYSTNLNDLGTELINLSAISDTVEEKLDQLNIDSDNISTNTLNFLSLSPDEAKKIFIKFKKLFEDYKTIISLVENDDDIKETIQFKDFKDFKELFEETIDNINNNYPDLSGGNGLKRKTSKKKTKKNRNKKTKRRTKKNKKTSKKKTKKNKKTKRN